jgi:hypothetical protein
MLTGLQGKSMADIQGLAIIRHDFESNEGKFGRAVARALVQFDKDEIRRTKFLRALRTNLPETSEGDAEYTRHANIPYRRIVELGAKLAAEERANTGPFSSGRSPFAAERHAAWETAIAPVFLNEIIIGAAYDVLRGPNTMAPPADFAFLHGDNGVKTVLENADSLCRDKESLLRDVGGTAEQKDALSTAFDHAQSKLPPPPLSPRGGSRPPFGGGGGGGGGAQLVQLAQLGAPPAGAPGDEFLPDLALLTDYASVHAANARHTAHMALATGRFVGLAEFTRANRAFDLAGLDARRETERLRLALTDPRSALKPNQMLGGEAKFRVFAGGSGGGRGAAPATRTRAPVTTPNEQFAAHAVLAALWKSGLLKKLLLMKHPQGDVKDFFEFVASPYASNAYAKKDHGWPKVDAPARAASPPSLLLQKLLGKGRASRPFREAINAQIAGKPRRGGAVDQEPVESFLFGVELKPESEKALAAWTAGAEGKDKAMLQFYTLRRVALVLLAELLPIPTPAYAAMVVRPVRAENFQDVRDAIQDIPGVGGADYWMLRAAARATPAQLNELARGAATLDDEQRVRPLLARAERVGKDEVNRVAAELDAERGKQGAKPDPFWERKATRLAREAAADPVAPEIADLGDEIKKAARAAYALPFDQVYPLAAVERRDVLAADRALAAVERRDVLAARAQGTAEQALLRAAAAWGFTTTTEGEVQTDISRAAASAVRELLECVGVEFDAATFLGSPVGRFVWFRAQRFVERLYDSTEGARFVAMLGALAAHAGARPMPISDVAKVLRDAHAPYEGMAKSELQAVLREVAPSVKFNLDDDRPRILVMSADGTEDFVMPHAMLLRPVPGEDFRDDTMLRKHFGYGKEELLARPVLRADGRPDGQPLRYGILRMVKDGVYVLYTWGYTVFSKGDARVRRQEQEAAWEVIRGAAIVAGRASDAPVKLVLDPTFAARGSGDLDIDPVNRKAAEILEKKGITQSGPDGAELTVKRWPFTVLHPDAYSNVMLSKRLMLADSEGRGDAAEAGDEHTLPAKGQRARFEAGDRARRGSLQARGDGGG